MEEVQGESFVLDTVCLSLEITQARRGAKDPPSPSSSSERDITSRARPPRPWKGKQSKKSPPSDGGIPEGGADDCLEVEMAENASGISASTSNSNHTRQSKTQTAQSVLSTPQHQERGEVSFINVFKCYSF